MYLFYRYQWYFLCCMVVLSCPPETGRQCQVNLKESVLPTQAVMLYFAVN